jgi:hypothetical protein
LKAALGALILIVAPAMAHAQTAADAFADRPDGAKVDIASGFVCPAKIGLFERDAVGEADPETGTDFCAYSALDGVYGTIKVTPLTGAYDPKGSFAADFAEQEGTGGKQISERPENMAAAGSAPLAVYTRTYETSKLEDLHYRVTFAGAEVKNWSVEATMEFADPRDTPVEQEFLHAVYAAAQTQIVAK